MRQGRTLFVTDVVIPGDLTVALADLDEDGTVVPGTIPQLELKVTEINTATTVTVTIARSGGGALYSSTITLAGLKTYVLMPAIEWYPDNDTPEVIFSLDAGDITGRLRVHLKDF